MNYSRKKSSQSKKWFLESISKAAFVLLAAAWFCSSVKLSPQEETEASLPASAEVYVETEENAKPVEDETSDVVEPSHKEDNFINPTEGVLTSDFGLRNGRQHNGIDIGSETGTEICAARSGSVIYADYMSGYGNYVIIEHSGGFETAYAHCDSILVDVGEEVEAGQLIAYMGSTGNSTGPHLHFEIRSGGEFCDPLDYVVY